MRKQKLKNYLKLGIFLFGISLTIFACQEESINDLQEISQEKKLKLISLNELNTRIGNSESYTALSTIFDINKPKIDGLQQRLENSDNP
ncbi:hypothetical protein [Olleya sp. HaHaR_3_96]|uniref:hypothetical protein n=1 Tax=Olleya sp. HaHaR_3_96 TaxID=2745560 RepID=UPI001C4F86E3|nr:hypothetical protein [Olleya sp. HaHaR_3_96]QXP60836.1 hypothetical protein H0I26_04145 [Olleya sp. HaHaR_3_96]